MYQKSITEEEKQRRLETYREAKALYEETIWEVKVQSWKTFVEQCLQTDVWGIPYKIVTKKIFSPTVLSTLRKADGTRTKNPFEKSKISEAIKRLKPKKTPGPDDISPKLLSHQKGI